jgi:mRNA interferase MazF
MGISRGDLIAVALSGAHGKPCPALVIQADDFTALPSVTVLPLTSEWHDWPVFRITLEPSPVNGLEKRSQIMIDKAVTVPRSKIGRRLGRGDPATLNAVGEALARFLGSG